MFIGSGLALGIGLGLTAGIASASSIADLGTTYDTEMPGFYSSVNGFLDYQGTDLGDFVAFFDDAPTVMSIFGTVSDPTSFIFMADFGIVGGDLVDVIGLSDSIISDDTAQYLFETGSVGYLVTISVDPGSMLDSPFADVMAPNAGEPANSSVVVDKYTNTAPIPLPATMPLILVGIGGLVYLRRRASS